jgi:hypothetical protein
LPDGPAKPGFGIERFSNAGNGWFNTFYVEETGRCKGRWRMASSSQTRAFWSWKSLEDTSR